MKPAIIIKPKNLTRDGEFSCFLVTLCNRKLNRIVIVQHQIVMMNQTSANIVVLASIIFNTFPIQSKNNILMSNKRLNFEARHTTNRSKHYILLQQLFVFRNY